ncbi:MAG: hypothetical protein JNJ61_05635 [Anaerolineae bacterium]|nr:hypothetical protein [Anaerolineae bacterium]
MAHKTAVSTRPAASHSNNKSDVNARINSCLSPVVAEILYRRLSTNSIPEEPPQVEVCLSPLLWSESFGFQHDG